jgi:ABC-type Zn uptake system ZnuABC Zn-binding protein ZnuA
MVEARAKVGLAFLVIFLLGFAAGALSWSAYRSRVDPARQAIWTGRFNRERYVRELTEAVRLQPEQMSAFNAALDETRDEFLALRRRLQPQFEEVRQRARQRIRLILNADQQPRFEVFLKRWDEERRREESAASQSRTSERK